MAIRILHEDDRLLAVSKPAGQVVIPGRGDLPGPTLLAELEALQAKKLWVVHRLDRGASGLVLFAKDAATHRRLSMQFEHRQVRKTYRVLVQGTVEKEGRIESPLRAFGSGRMGVAVSGKPSVTEFSVNKVYEGATLLNVFPHTGRRHQIRVHLYSLGHPVMGDALYGKDRPVGNFPRLMLHAWELELADADGSRLTLRADPPPDFDDAMARLKMVI